MYPTETKKPGRNWAQRIASRDNLWIEAMHREDDGRLTSAAATYARDAVSSFQSHNLARAALSCACAAHCFEKMGEAKLASILFAEAAGIYEQHSYETIEGSIRESVWALERAYENYALAQDEHRSYAVYGMLASLSKKISPHFGQRELDELSEFHKTLRNRSHRQRVSNPNPKNIEELIETVRELLEFIVAFRQLLVSRSSDVNLVKLDKLIFTEHRTNE